MDVTINQDPVGVAFGTLLPGDLFVRAGIAETLNLYIKINLATLQNFQIKTVSGTDFNAISVADGTIVYFADTDLVLPALEVTINI